MHLVQTPGETVYEIKLADLLCSLALEPKTFLKRFAKETSIEAKKKPLSQNQQIQNNKNPHLVMSLRAHVTQMRKKERSEERRKNISQGF